MVTLAPLSCHIIIVSSSIGNNGNLASEQCLQYGFVVPHHCSVLGLRDLVFCLRLCALKHLSHSPLPPAPGNFQFTLCFYSDNFNEIIKIN